MSDEGRAFDNPYRDYDNSKDLTNVADPLKWPQDVENFLQNNLMKLLKKLDSNLKDGVDWYDYSVYTGTSGYALLYYHLSNVLQDDRDTYFNKALHYLEKPLSRLKCQRFSFLCGDAGPLALGAVIYRKAGKIQQSTDLIQRFVNFEDSDYETAALKS